MLGRVLLVAAIAAVIGVVLGLRRRGRRRDADDPEGAWGLERSGLVPEHTQGGPI